MKSISIILMGLALMLASPTGQACTSAVVSGKATVDGRPLLWKNRDTSSEYNEIVFCDDGKYSYIGIINAGDDVGMEIWAGINSAGFAIMNTASYNMEKSGQRKDGEGRWMKVALQSCASVADFEKLLQRTNVGGRDVAANFGTIDRFGGACFFETGQNSYYRFDANDPKQAPHGFLIRTNYSLQGTKHRGYGYIRYERAQELFLQARQNNQIDNRFILQIASRDLFNAKIQSDPCQAKLTAPFFIHANDTINRYITASAFVAHGVAPKENPALTTMWCLLGEPIASVAVPLWIGGKQLPPEVNGTKKAPLNVLARKIKKWCYPLSHGSHRQYLEAYRLLKPNGLLMRLLAFENTVFEETQQQLRRWRAKQPDNVAMAKFQCNICQQSYIFLQKQIAELHIEK